MPTTAAVPTATPRATSSESSATKPLWEKRLSEVFWINSVAVSSNGRRVMAATYLHDYKNKGPVKGLPNIQSKFGAFCLDDTSPKDPKTGAPQKPLWSNEYVGWDGVFGVAISGDGTVAAASGFNDKVDGVENTFRGLLRAFDASNGDLLLDHTEIRSRVSWVSLSNDGRVLAAVADDVYVFIRDGNAFNPSPLKLGIGATANNFVTNVALHPTGTWLAATDQIGHVYAASIDIAGRTFTSQDVWTGAEAFPFLSVAIASTANTFVAGGGNFVFLFGRDAMGKITQPLEFDTRVGQDPATIPPDKDDGRLQENVRWVAISANGQLLTAGANRKRPDKPYTGMLFALTPDGTQLRQLWAQPLDNNPNSTCVDPGGTLVSVCDGYPTGRLSKFHLFDADGTPRWDYEVCNMNWPMVISADASTVVGGSDDGTVYYFKA